MSMERWAKKNKEAENQFNRLPDDVIVNIFDKLSDIKWLCRCFVVSKRFASLIPLVQTLSIKTNACDYLSIPRLTSNVPHGNNLLRIYSYFVSKLLFLKPLRCLPKLALPPPSFLLDVSRFVFLAKLKQIRSLNLDLVSDFRGNNYSVFKWGAKFTTKLDSVTFLYAASLSKMMESEEEEEETENAINQEELIRRVDLGFNCILEAVLWLDVVSLFFPKYPMLRSISITDSMNKGVRQYLAAEKPVACMNDLNWNWMVSDVKSWMQDNTRVGYVPVLQLPVSGYVMKRVNIIHFKLNDDADSDADLAMADAFVEEQGVFLEAMVQILENYKDSIKAMYQNWD